MSRAVTLVQKTYLRPAQKKLYELIVTKLDADEIITLQEAEQIWRSRVAQNMVKGVPHRTTYVPEEDASGEVNFWRATLVPMTDDEITERVMLWLTSNIGILVIRGYLKVIPMIEVKQLRQQK